MEFVKDIGTNLYLGGFILVGQKDPTLVLFPETELSPGVDYKPYHLWSVGMEVALQVFKPTLEQFQEIIRQMDVMETEITQDDGSKAIVRKSQRSLDNRITWQVFKRDGFKCRYCGNDDVPLTYEHVLRWEEGGANTLENGLACCNKCNKQRGDMDYEVWLNSKIYQQKSKNLDPEIIIKNLELIFVYKGFNKRVSAKSR